MATRLTAQQKRDRLITEAQWQARVCDLATLWGWRYYHAPENRPVIGRNGRRYVQNIRAGWPDLALVRGRRLLFVELKTEIGKVSDDQQGWLDALAATGAETWAWRPRDWDTVQQVLR